ILGFSQFGNDWFDIGKSYYKVAVAKDGIYRVPKSSLAAAGMPTQSISNVEYRVYARGKEIYAKVEQDYISFYGIKNDGELDQALFEDPNNQSNTAYSFYSDTTYYYITYTPGQNGLRYIKNNETNTGGKTEITYHLAKKTQAFSDFFIPGERPNGALYHPHFSGGEGYMSNRITRAKNVFMAKTFDISDYIEIATVNPTVETTLIGANSPNNTDQLPDGTAYDCRPFISYTSSGSETILVSDYKLAYSYKRYILDLPTDAFTSKSLTFKANVHPDSENGVAIAGQIRCSHFTLSYAAKFDMLSNKSYEFKFPNAISTERFIKIVNVPDGEYQVFDMANGIELSTTMSNGELTVVIPKSAVQHHLYISELKEITNLTPKKYVFKDLELTEGIEYIVLSSYALENSASEYLSYRTSAAGGNLKGKLIFAEDLYDHYYYGLHHPIAVKRFFADLVTNYTTPTNIFIIGKGIDVRYLRPDANTLLLADDLVPTIGFPASDTYYGADLTPGQRLCPFGIGRLAARTDAEVKAYLKKVKVYEKLPPEIWRKNVLHVGGGQDGDITRFNGYLSSLQEIVEAPNYGAKVYFLGKTTRNVIEDLDQSIVDRIDNGITFFSYFGHGSGNNLEINIGNPTTYNNALKPMIMYFSGCAIGQCCNTEVFLGESYLTAETGAINWIAPINLSFENELYGFTREFYTQMSANSYGKTLGEIMVNTHKGFTQIGVLQSESQTFSLFLQGDPANRLFSPEKPDFLVQKTDVYVTPEDVTAQNDFFEINTIVRNNGKNIEDTVDLKLRITYPDNTRPLDTVVRVQRVTHSQLVTIKIDNSIRKQFGLFGIEVVVDPENEFDEEFENNNSVKTEFNLISNGAAPIFPSEYGIVGEHEVTLTAQALDPSVARSTYFFEIDTIPTFKSPWKKRSRSLTSGQLAKWNVSLLSKDTQAYYWRVTIELDEGGTAPWKVSTFSYIKSSGKGWAQVNYHQKQSIEIESMYWDTISRKTNFAQDAPESYFVWQHGRAFGDWKDNPYTFGKFPPGNDAKGFREPASGGAFAEQIANGLSENGIVVYALEPNKLEKYLPAIDVNRQLITEENGVYRFDWMTSENTVDQRVVDSFLKYMDNLPRGYHFFALSGYYHHLEGMKNERIYKALEACGSKDIRGVQNNGVWCMIGRKGSPIGSAEEDYTTDQTIQMRISRSLGRSKTSGKMTSILVGPAKKWRSAELLVKNYDAIKTNDKVEFTITGFDNTGQAVNMARVTRLNPIDLSYIDASIYPFLELSIKVDDEVNFTPNQLENWLVLYDPLPDGMVNADLAYKFKADTIKRGQLIEVEIGFQNISSLTLPAMEATYTISDDKREIVYFFREEVPALNPDESVILSRNINSDDFKGANRFELKFNPSNTVAERYYFNNTFQRSFIVEADNEIPQLDVTFDGIRILNGDIISPSPKIKISGKDNDKYFLLDNPDYFDVTIKKEGETLPTQLDISRDDVNFYPASDGNNQAYFEFNPENLEDGLYTLAVQLSDASGNKAGKIAYEVHFEVVNNSTITNFYPYPNPFSSKMKFVYTVTGTEVPDNLLVQIFTLSGKVVKEIELTDFGAIKIGHNISEYSWDGTDEFGNVLANGVYMYKVHTSYNGQLYEHRRLTSKNEDVSLESQFIDGFGKIYIMR
ncbi:MAG: hypothetical protein KDC92_10775, partial [Bacteroidetes bacterium]|nr:hypothetical protein [Bacteroidota bacterium]